MLGIIIQARTGSSRLPNKMILPFYKNFGILEILLKRLINNINCKIIVATTTNNRDNIIEEITTNSNCICYRGSEDDVILRFIEAAKYNGVTKIIRICADNPFLDMESLKALIDYCSNKDEDYISYITSKGVPTIKTHYGFWAKYTTLEVLMRVNALTNEKIYHEHVTNYIYEHSDMFKTNFIKIPVWIENKSIRLTLDTKEDFAMQQIIFNSVTNMIN